jgi:hypothetical protein
MRRILHGSAWLWFNIFWVYGFDGIQSFGVETGSRQREVFVLFINTTRGRPFLHGEGYKATGAGSD